MRLRARVDNNQAELLRAAVQLGFSVVDTSRLGRGFPDAVIGRGGINYLVEFKGPKGKLTSDQELFHASWRGGPVNVVRTIEDLITMLNHNKPQ